MSSPVNVEILAHRTCTSTGEGPFWESEEKKLTYVDIGSGDIHQFDTVTSTDTKYHVGDGTVGFVVPRKSSSSYIVGYKKTLTDFDPSTGKTTTLLEVEHKKENRFNDGKCDSSGRLYAGTMPINVSQEPLKLRRNDSALYSLETNGALVKRWDAVSLSNGLAWTADDKTMFYVDSIPKMMYAYDYDAATGDMTNQRTFKCFDDPAFESYGVPDGMTIDIDDNLWLAHFFGGRITKWDSRTGTLLQEVEIPGADRITSCCFGGPNMDELYVTSCASDYTEDDYKKSPNAGSLFKVTGLGVKGVPSLKYGA